MSAQLAMPQYAYQSEVRSSPLIQAVLARIKTALDAMKDVPVIFVTNYQTLTPDVAVFHEHSGQTVAEFLSPAIESMDGLKLIFDEECLPFYKLKFTDGVTLDASDDELFSTDPRLQELISAVSGAFFISREFGYLGIWDLAARASDEEKEVYLKEYALYKDKASRAFFIPVS